MSIDRSGEIEDGFALFCAQESVGSFQPSLRDSSGSCTHTQDYVLGKGQPSLRDCSQIPYAKHTFLTTPGSPDALKAIHN